MALYTPPPIYIVEDKKLIQKHGQKTDGSLTHRLLSVMGWELFEDKTHSKVEYFYQNKNREMWEAKYKPSSCKEIYEFVEFIFKEGQRIGVEKGISHQIDKNRELFSQLIGRNLDLVGEWIYPTRIG